MPNFGQKSKVLAIAADGDAQRESTMKGLLSYNKERLLGSLNQIKSGGAVYAESLSNAQQVSRHATHQDPEIATAAITCLGLMGFKAQKFEQLLEGCTQSPVGSVRAAAVEALGRLGPYISGVEVIKGAATDAEGAVRAKFCQAAAEMEATSLHASVSALLEDPVPEVQCAAIESLGYLITISQEMQSLYGDKVGDYLSKMLASSSTRVAALDTIADMGEQAPSSCTSAVVGALGDADIFTRHSAVAAFSVLAESASASKEGLSKIKDFLGGEDPGVRSAAACALATMGEKAAGSAEAVAALLSDKSEDTSGSPFVMGGGGRRPPPQMRRPKCAAVTALGRIGGSTYVSKISEALNDGNWEVRLSAAEALGAMKAKGEVSALLGSMEDDAFPVRAMCCYALGQIKDSEATSRLVDALEDSAYSVRLYAVQALAEIGEAAEEHSHEVFKLTDDTATSVRAAAVKALAKLGSTGANYAGVVCTMLSDPDMEVRAAACEALGGMGDAGAACAEEVEELLSDVPPVRAAAVEALEGMGRYVSPFKKDFGKGLGVPNDAKPGVLMPGEISLDGLGLYFGDIMQKKQELAAAGKWIEGVL